MGFSWQEYRTGLLYHPLGDLPNSGIEPTSLAFPALAGGFFTTSVTWEVPNIKIFSHLNNKDIIFECGVHNAHGVLFCICICVCVCVCVYQGDGHLRYTYIQYIYIQVSVHRYIYIPIHIQIYTHKYTHTHTNICVF